MPRFSREGATRVESMPGFEGRYGEAGGYTVGFESFEEGGDFTPFYRGLPDDLCQSPHWGYVLKGRLVLHRPEGDEVVEAGEAYYVPPGHTGEVGPGTEIVEFSPTEEWERTMEVVKRNLQEMA